MYRRPPDYGAPDKNQSWKIWSLGPDGLLSPGRSFPGTRQPSAQHTTLDISLDTVPFLHPLSKEAQLHTRPNEFPATMSMAAECQRWLRRKQYTFEVTFALNMFRSWEKSVICVFPQGDVLVQCRVKLNANFR